MTDNSELTPAKQRTLDQVRRRAAEGGAARYEMANEVKVAKRRLEDGDITPEEFQRIFNAARQRGEDLQAAERQQGADAGLPDLQAAWDKIKDTPADG